MDHSEVKVRVLKNYMAAYLNILANSRHIKDIHVYDLFCGPGVYDNGGFGSPMILLNEIREAYQNTVLTRQSNTKFHCTFNDLDSAKVEELKGHVARHNLASDVFGKVKYDCRDYEDWIPELVARFNALGNDRGFAFIDPYGYKEIKLDDIRRLLSSGKSEVLLFLPTNFMFRFHENGTPESLRLFLDEVLEGMDLPSDGNSIDFIETITEGFRRKLGQAHFVDTFIIERDKNQFFCLFFFTSHILGYEKMLEAKWKVDQENGRGWQYSAGFDLFSQLENRANTVRLKDLLMNFLGENARTNAEVYEFTLRNGYLSKHANEILNDLQSQGRLTVELQDGQKARKSSFYLNWDNYKNSPDRVRIKLN